MTRTELKKEMQIHCDHVNNGLVDNIYMLVIRDDTHNRRCTYEYDGQMVGYPREYRPDPVAPPKGTPTWNHDGDLFESVGSFASNGALNVIISSTLDVIDIEQWACVHDNSICSDGFQIAWIPKEMRSK